MDSPKSGMKVEMAFAKSGDSQRECREFANDTNELEKIRVFRSFALFAFQSG